MKNIHVLSTDRPSRLHLAYNKDYYLSVEPFVQLDTKNYKSFNLYITSNEEIKDGDWYFDGTDFIHKKTKYNDALVDGNKQAKKVIITTDQSLIKDGVQAIDDEFLKWFVKNPSCESVEIRKWFDYESDPNISYEIIIPKEEPKQDNKWSESTGDITSDYFIAQSKAIQKCMLLDGEMAYNSLHKQGTMSEAIKQVINEHLQKEPNQSAVEFLVEKLQSESFMPKDSIVINNFIKVAVELENQRKDKYATDFLDSIREYERENGSRICFDERDSKEFLEIYKTGKD